MNDPTHHIGILAIDVFMPSAQSLKEKRMILKSLKDRVRNKFNVSIAELDGEDKWQTATVGISMIGNDRRYMDSCLQNIVSYVESFGQLEISDHSVTFF